MRLLLLIPLLAMLSCGNQSNDKKTSPEPVSQTDTLKRLKKPDSADSIRYAPSELMTAVNDSLQKKFNEKWHVLNDREAHWIKGEFDYFIAPKRKENPDYPYITSGDFNGDGRPDLAAVVKDKEKREYRIAILPAGSKPFLWEEDIMEDAAISTIPKTVLSVTEDEGLKPKKIKMKGDGINVEYFEQATFVIYWSGSVYKKTQTGD